MLVLWLLKLAIFSTVVAGIDYLPTKFLWSKQTKYNTSSIIPWEIKVSSPAVFVFFGSENSPFFDLNIGLANHKGFFNLQKYKNLQIFHKKGFNVVAM